MKKTNKKLIVPTSFVLSQSGIIVIIITKHTYDLLLKMTEVEYLIDLCILVIEMFQLWMKAVWKLYGISNVITCV